MSWARVLLGGASVVGVGMALLAITTPTDEQFINSLGPELRKKYEDTKEARRQMNAEAYEKLKSQGFSQDLRASENPAAFELRVHEHARQAAYDKEIGAERERLRKLAEQEKT